uniref:Uncharacterized protein n=1 Tax=Candidatus Kentrum sp. MB TaxID=2138164 RepID=A0A450XZU5_9GAMM|nr:MAG: hypothetical protein BECKMB1821G_GA0114241_100965 [Candidatus Kentron sp. MB]VFK34799.1 MAG: hypothetical protein BECKMB1821I_GA0114274_10853 [Candidatus Kentron sp. MB]VFK74196.1 MAG: hypothetical protein BECKMB1821H_GA0114242_100215 [Candidatus Kentron sp. MB]
MKANIAVVIGSYHKKEGEEMLNEVRDYAKKNDDVRIVDEGWFVSRSGSFHSNEP